jgi:DNA-binding response OmpR family regulator
MLHVLMAPHHAAPSFLQGVTVARILVVEDEVLIRMLVVDMLSDLAHQSDEAGNAAEALDKLSAAPSSYALVLLDIGLPDRSGDDVVREVREIHPDLPLLVASGEDAAALKTRLVGFAPIAFLTKPYDTAQLREALQAFGI